MGRPIRSLTATYLGFVNGETNTALDGVLVLTSPAQTNSPVGPYPITASGLSATNYSISYSNGTLNVLPQALTVTAQDQTKVYGAADSGFTAAYSGLVDGETSAALGGTLTFSRVPGEDVGTYAITPAGLTSTNYAITFASGTLTINPAGLTITADNQSKAYGAALPGLTVSYSGWVNGDTAASLTIPPAVTTTGTASSAVGTYPITASGAVDANYTISYVAGTLTVNPVGLTITANDQSKAYGAALPALTVSYNGFVNGDTAASLTTAPTVTTTGTASSAVGTYPITASGAVDANYTISYVAGTLTVNPAGLTITANNQSKAYGAALPALTVSYGGLVNGDTAASLTTPPTVTTTRGRPAARWDLPDHGHRCGGRQLHDQLCGRDADGQPGGADDHGQRPEQGLRGGVPARRRATAVLSMAIRGQSDDPPTVTTTGTAGSAWQLPDHGQRGGGCQLHDQLRGGRADGQPGGVDDHGQQPKQGLRGGAAGLDGELQWLCQRGHGGESDDRADSDDDRAGEQSGGQLPDHGQRGGGCQLHDQLCGGDADGQSGGADDHGRRPEQGLWGGTAGLDGELQRLCQRGHGGS